MKYVDNFLNKITMYKTVLYVLCVFVLLSFVLSLFEMLTYKPIELLLSLLILVSTCWISNFFFSKLFKVPANSESYIISALILYLIIYPNEAISNPLILVLAGFLAMASKYLLVINKKHLFNPVAISIFVIGLLGWGVSSWWVGGGVFLIPSLVLDFLVLRKVRRFELFFAFIFSTFVSLLVFYVLNGGNLSDILITTLLSTPLLFLGSIMLTEPLTSPPTKKMQIIYGIIVGGLFGSQFSFGALYSTPEFALLVGGIFSYFVSPRIRLVLSLLKKSKLSADVYEFVWKINNKPSKREFFEAGQYLEWTLGHANPDIRGNRRFFTISSSPTEEDLRLGVKFYEPGSSFKKGLLALEEGDTLVASQLSGEFTLPKDKNKKLVFIAGGIGVTPFRSMAKYIIDKKERVEATLLYSNKTPNDIVYKNIFDEAKEFGVNTIYAVNDLAGSVQADDMRVGFINAEMIMKEIPDYKDRIFYISGPHGMVTAFEDSLSKLGIPKSNIKIDFFPGFV